jgi:hypothetical protein
MTSGTNAEPEKLFVLGAAVVFNGIMENSTIKMIEAIHLVVALYLFIIEAPLY